MTNASDIQAEINAALAEATASVGNGPLQVTIVRKGARSGPDYEPVYASDTEHTVNGLIGSYTAFERSGGLIEQTDIKLTIAAGQGIDPTNADHVRIDDKIHEIKSVTPSKPAGEPLSYKLQVKS